MLTSAISTTPPKTNQEDILSKSVIFSKSTNTPSFCPAPYNGKSFQQIKIEWEKNDEKIGKLREKLSLGILVDKKPMEIMDQVFTETKYNFLSFFPIEDILNPKFLSHTKSAEQKLSEREQLLEKIKKQAMFILFYKENNIIKEIILPNLKNTDLPANCEIKSDEKFGFGLANFLEGIKKSYLIQSTGTCFPSNFKITLIKPTCTLISDKLFETLLNEVKLKIEELNEPGKTESKKVETSITETSEISTSTSFLIERSKEEDARERSKEEEEDARLQKSDSEPFPRKRSLRSFFQNKKQNKASSITPAFKDMIKNQENPKTTSSGRERSLSEGKTLETYNDPSKQSKTPLSNRAKHRDAIKKWRNDLINGGPVLSEQENS